MPWVRCPVHRHITVKTNFGGGFSVRCHACVGEAIMALQRIRKRSAVAGAAGSSEGRGSR